MKGKTLLTLSSLIILVLSGALFLFLDHSRITAAATRLYHKIQLAMAPIPAADILLPVVFDKQDHALSCEAAVLKMALVYHGVSVDESELIDKIGTDTTPKSIKNSQLIWGDPQKGFVGNIDGKMPSSGYGVYWEPVARAAGKYRPAASFTGWSIDKLAGEIRKGNPVLIWGHLGNGDPLSWKTSDGRTIKAVHYEHAFIVNGLKGSVESPEGFFLVDPIYGHMYWPVETLLSHWSSLGYSGVTIQ